MHVQDRDTLPLALSELHSAVEREADTLFGSRSGTFAETPKMTASDSEGSLYEPEMSPPINAASEASRHQPGRSARDLASHLDFSSDAATAYTDSAAQSGLPTGANTSAVGTPAGSDTGFDDGDDSAAMLTTAEQTPDPQPQPVKRSKALNFLKKKEPKTSVVRRLFLRRWAAQTRESPELQGAGS